MEKRKVAGAANFSPKVATFSSPGLDTTGGCIENLNIKKSVHFLDSPEILEYMPSEWSDPSDVDPYFEYLRQSLDAPDVGPLVCNILSETELTESDEDPNPALFLANRIIRKCRSVWPVDIDRI